MPPWFQIGRRSPSCESRAAGFSRRSGGGGCGRQGEGGGWRGGQEAGGKEKGDASHTILLPAAVGWSTRRATASSPPLRHRRRCLCLHPCFVLPPSLAPQLPVHSLLLHPHSLVSHRRTNLPRLGRERRPWRILRL
uniref:Uncharacterized protein n=1 Tax=Triticum urartu TaxID=4572 RepID=A0A8R7QHS4_TRIUA